MHGRKDNEARGEADGMGRSILLMEIKKERKELLNDMIVGINKEYRGILVFNDKEGKFGYVKNSLKLLTSGCDIKIGTQDKDGKPKWLTVEVSAAGTLDRQTFERKEGVTVVYAKAPYESTRYSLVFDFVKVLEGCFCYNLKRGLGPEEYYVKTKFGDDPITKEEYYDVDFPN